MPTKANRERGYKNIATTWTVERCRRVLARTSPERTWTDDEILTLRDTLAEIARLRLQTLRASASK
jgi:16S rRNA U1498 N3-methylase RsmE